MDPFMLGNTMLALEALESTLADATLEARRAEQSERVTRLRRIADAIFSAEQAVADAMEQEKREVSK